MSTADGLPVQPPIEQHIPKKVARGGRPEWHNAGDLQRFLREDSGSDYQHIAATKRHSGASSKYSNGKDLLRNLLHTRSPTPPLDLPSVSNRQAIKHDCVMLRQEVPGNQKQYFRIVRDSSLFDSLETKSTFEINYHFQRHDVQEVKDVSKRKANSNSGKKTAGLSPTKQPSKNKSRFRLRTKSAMISNQRLRLSDNGRKDVDETRENQFGRWKRSPILQQEGPSQTTGRSGGPPRIHISDKGKLQSSDQDISLNLDEAASVPQIRDLTAHPAFPAAELIRSWSKRQSVKSIQCSPTKASHLPLLAASNQSVNSSNVNKGLDNNFAVSRIKSQQQYQSPFDKSRSRPVFGSPTKPLGRSARLASPVKLGRIETEIMRSGQQTRKTTDRNLEQLPLRSNPSQQLSVSVPGNMNESTFTNQTSAASNASTSAGDNARREQHKSQKTCFSAASASFGSSTEASLILSKTGTKTKSIGSPTTPPPNVPLPPLPARFKIKHTSPSKLSHDPHQQYSDQMSFEHPALLNSPARLFQTTAIHQETQNREVTNLKVTESPIPIARDICTTQHEDLKKEVEHEIPGEDATMSGIQWPQPPQSRPNSRDLDKSPTEQEISTPENDVFYTRKVMADALRRRHIEESRSLRSLKAHRKSTSSQAPSDSVIELPSVRSSRPDHMSIAFGHSAGGSDYAASDSNRKISRPESLLGFSKVKTEAEIRPPNRYQLHTTRTFAGRTIYRSHSTQMSPAKATPPQNQDGSVEFEYPAIVVNGEQAQVEETQKEQIVTDKSADEMYVDQALEQGTLKLQYLNRAVREMEHNLEKRMLTAIDSRLASLDRRMHLIETAIAMDTLAQCKSCTNPG